MPDQVTVLGGYHITFMPKEMMGKCPAIDLGVISEGEGTMLKLVRSIESGRPIDPVDAAVIRVGGKIRMIGPRRLIEYLDTPPFLSKAFAADGEVHCTW